LKSIEYLLEEREVGPESGGVRRDGVTGLHASCLEQIGQEHRDDVERQPQMGAELRHRQRFAAAAEDFLVLVLQSGRVATSRVAAGPAGLLRPPVRT
jgi:hypothetical protein